MTRNIVICADGTGNRGGAGQNTNVWRIYNAAAGKESDDQYAIYSDGVGTERQIIQRILGATVGYGVSANISSLYSSLCHVYKPGANIYLFGFSRGAHTIRTLAGLITSQGILKPHDFETDSDFNDQVKLLYSAYRTQNFIDPDNSDDRSLFVQFFSHRFFIHFYSLFSGKQNVADSIKHRTQQIERLGAIRKNLYVHKISDDWENIDTSTRAALEEPVKSDGCVKPIQKENRVAIRFIGVWDTVDAVGFPVEWMADYWNTYVYRYQFRNYRLSPLVSNACHALAIDDARKSFKPRLFDCRKSANNADSDNPESQDDRIKQIWFAGVHSNIGGGYAKQGLAHISLCWIADTAKNLGLIVDDDTVVTVSDNQVRSQTKKIYASQTNPHDRLYDSRSGLSGNYKYTARDITALHNACHDTNADHSSRPLVDSSVLARIARRTETYSPWNLPPNFEVVDSCEASPCKFLDYEEAEEGIARQWHIHTTCSPGNGATEPDITSIRKQSENITRRLRWVRSTFVISAFLYATSSIFGILEHWLASILFVFVFLSCFVAHRSIDVRAQSSLSESASKLWVSCLNRARENAKCSSK